MQIVYLRGGPKREEGEVRQREGCKLDIGRKLLWQALTPQHLQIPKGRQRFQQAEKALSKEMQMLTAEFWVAWCVTMGPGN